MLVQPKYSLLKPSRWAWQRHLADRVHPETRALFAFWEGAGLVRGLMNGIETTVHGAGPPEWQATERGPGLFFAGDRSLNTTLAGTFQELYQPSTVTIIFRYTSTSRMELYSTFSNTTPPDFSARYSVNGLFGTERANGFGAQFITSSAQEQEIVTGTNQLNNGQYNIVTVRKTGAAAGTVSIWINGSSRSVTNPKFNSTTDNPTLGAAPRIGSLTHPTSNLYFTGHVLLIEHIAAALADAEIEERHRDWFGAIRPSSRMFVPFISVSAPSGDVNFTASGSSASSGSATLNLDLGLVASGSSASGGSATLGLDLGLTAAGHSASSGSATLTVDVSGEVNFTASGHSASDGTATLSLDLGLTASGHSASSGSATLTVDGAGEVNFTASGHSASGGSATLTLDLAFTASGSSASFGAATLTIDGPEPLLDLTRPQLNPIDYLPANRFPTADNVLIIQAFIELHGRAPTPAEAEALVGPAVAFTDRTDPLPDGFAGRNWSRRRR